MKSLSDDSQPPLSLRERKKLKTRAAIRRHALKLFREQGFANTTIDQIVDPLEISQSTFFRYFPTKEDVVLQDDLDDLMFAAFKRQPAEMSPLSAVRAAMHEVFSGLSAEERAEEREREALIFATPELRSRMLDDFGGTLQMVAELLSQRLSHQPNAFALRVFSGALVGAMLATTTAMVEDPDADPFTLIDEALGYLEAGLPL